MLAPAILPEEYAAWNREHGAPAGFVRPKRELFRRFYSDEKWLRLKGPFGIQPGNNSTRQFEYPWAFHATKLPATATIVELGGSLAGLQFVLSRLGHKVINVDPGLDAGGLGWPVDHASVDRLNRWFGTDVQLVNATLDKAALPDESIDAIFSISVLEHLTDAELAAAMQAVRRCLRPGGRFVVTLDLFLNLAPFTNRVQNEFGTNKDVRDIVEQSGLRLVHGNPAELNGFPTFEPEQILANLERYIIGTYPVLTQCIVLEKLGEPRD